MKSPAPVFVMMKYLEDDQIWAASCSVTKPTKWHVRPAKTQISLDIRPFWSESSLCAEWVAKDPRFLHADSKDSDQTGRMPRLIWVFAGRTCHFVGFVTMRLKWMLKLPSLTIPICQTIHFCKFKNISNIFANITSLNSRPGYAGDHNLASYSVKISRSSWLYKACDQWQSKDPTWDLIILG